MSDKKEYWNNGNLRYEGEMKDGEYHGKGKLYCADGELQYEGEFKNSEYDGYGKLYYYDYYGKTVCIGEWKNGNGVFQNKQPK